MRHHSCCCLLHIFVLCHHHTHTAHVLCSLLVCCCWSWFVVCVGCGVVGTHTFCCCLLLTHSLVLVFTCLFLYLCFWKHNKDVCVLLLFVVCERLCFFVFVWGFERGFSRFRFSGCVYVLGSLSLTHPLTLSLSLSLYIYNRKILQPNSALKFKSSLLNIISPLLGIIG